MDAEQVQTKLQFSADEDSILTAWQYRMLQRDIAASRGKQLAATREVRNAFRNAAVQAIAQRDEADWSAVVAEAVHRIGPQGGAPNLEALEDAGPEVSSVVSKRSRALLILIDLYGFEPWVAAKWDKNARAKTLSEAHQALDQLHPEDLSAVETAYRDAVKTLAKAASRKKYALLAGAGLGLGVLTGGLAAPAIAAAYGTVVLGFSGAAATSAGRAALGGGAPAGT